MLNANKSRLPILRELTLRNILSYGAEAQPLRLQRLNVLVGPNGSGKSNLIDALALVRAAQSDFRRFISQRGGVSEWVWKGNPNGMASIEVVIDMPDDRPALRHALGFHAEDGRFRLLDEFVFTEFKQDGLPIWKEYYSYNDGNPLIRQNGDSAQPGMLNVFRDVSIVQQRSDPDYFPPLHDLTSAYHGFRFYREWTFGRNTVFREPQKADLRTDQLEEDYSNLGMFLNRLRRNPQVKLALITALSDLYEGLTDFEIAVEGGTVQVFFTEGDYTIPATRLSDGSLRYLCLLAILLDPDPPPLICIEEPELGLHPDMLPKISDLLFDASQRTQLIVTTHSDILVDALTEHPEVVLVCEKHDGRTQIQRLDSSRLARWLEKYRLGALWTSGEIGGTRW
ncbi:MAG: AAA family ATPase [Chloroflexi bacterium]|nr:AAA family ATPase [Chloroflexota bacterium]